MVKDHYQEIVVVIIAITTNGALLFFLAADPEAGLRVRPWKVGLRGSTTRQTRGNTPSCVPKQEAAERS